jgi:hypothetical protein
VAAYKAHIFKQRKVGEREEVKLKLFNPDGTLIDLGNVGGGESVGGGGEYVWLGGYEPFTPPIDTPKTYAPFEYEQTNSGLFSILTGSDGVKEGIQILAEGSYLVQASGIRPSSIAAYYPELDSTTNSQALFASPFSLNFDPISIVARLGFVIVDARGEEFWAKPKIRFLVGTASTSEPIGDRELYIVKL